MKKKLLFISTILLVGFVLISMSNIKLSEQEPWSVPSKYKKMENPFAKATDGESIGRILYSKHCKSCHGSKGKGDGKKAASSDTKVPDFTNPEFIKQTDGSLYYKTYIGRDDMPGFEKKITDKEDQWLLINYMKTLAK